MAVEESLGHTFRIFERARAYAVNVVDEETKGPYPVKVLTLCGSAAGPIREAMYAMVSRAFVEGYAAAVEEAGKPKRVK